MEILTPEEKQKEKKLYRNLYTLLIVLPLIALATWFGYTNSQTAIATNATEAIKAGNIEEAKDWALQLDSWDHLDKNRETVLMVACETGVAEFVDWVLAHGADPNYSPRGSMTPLELYCSFGFRAGPQTLSRLLKAGARISNYELTPPIFCLGTKLIWMTPDERDVAFEEMLILYNNGDKMSYNGVTLFHYAAQYDNEALAYALLSSLAGANQLTAKDPNGKTPYELALMNGSASVQRLIRRFEEGLRAEEEEIPSETTKPEDNKDELDALINSLVDQSSNKGSSNSSDDNDIPSN